MNKDVKQAADELKTAIDSDKLIQEYNLLAQKIAESTEVQDLEAKLKELQQQLVKALDDNLSDLYESVKKQYLELKDIYDKHPLVNNYQALKEEMTKVLSEVETILKEI